MSEDPWRAGHETSVSIKYAGGHDATWAVFRGSPEEIRADILAYFDMADEGKSLNDVVLEATVLAHAMYAAATGLDAKSEPPKKMGKRKAAAKKKAEPKAEEKAEESESPFKDESDDDWDKPLPEKDADDGAESDTGEPEDPNAAHYQAMENAPDVKTLKLYYSQNKAAFDDADLMTAWKARGKALKEAA